MSPDTQTIDARAFAERLETARERIEQACQRAGRSADEVKLVAVSKTFPLEAIEVACDLGLRAFGENRAGELSEKAEALPGEHLGGDVQWHMIGHLQRNKAKDVAEHADVFQALDSPRLAKELDKRCRREERVMPCLAQVNIAGQEQKYGLAPEETHAFLDGLAQYECLRVCGLMAMAKYTDDPETVRPSFRRMRELFETYDASANPRVQMDELSIGMSGDFEVAIEEGATQVRLGSALFGSRDYD